MENNFEKALFESAEKFKICILIGLIIRLLLSPIFLFFYILGNVLEIIPELLGEIKKSFIKTFINPIKKYKKMKRLASEEALKIKVDFIKSNQERSGKKWDGKIDGWREWIGYVFQMLE